MKQDKKMIKNGAYLRKGYKIKKKAGIKLYIKCYKCAKNFIKSLTGEAKFKCPYCGQGYLYMYMGGTKYKIFKLED